MSNNSVKQRQEWLLNGCSDKLSKQEIIDSYICYFLDKCYSIFDIKGLPKTIPKREFLRYLFLEGWLVIPNDKINDNYYAFTGGLGGVLNEYYEPTKAIITNPYLNYQANLEIGKDCTFIRCDSTMQGLYPLFNRYAKLIAECDVSFRINTINTRLSKVFQADNSNAIEGYKQYIKDIEDGNTPQAILGKYTFDNLQDVNKTNGTQSFIKDIIELKQYLIASFYQEIGINSNFNMKRESINVGESALNDQALIPLVQDMYENIKHGLDEFNSKSGYNVVINYGINMQKNINNIIENIESEDNSNESVRNT